jgi:tetratricopeptide (TPR) repeat protein
VFNLAIDALNGGVPAVVKPLVERSLRIHPGDARLWQALGLLHRALDDLEPAVAAFAGAAAIAPADPLIAHSHARARMEAGLSAVDEFETAHRLAPNDGSVLLGRAAALFAEGRIEEAISGLEEQLRRNPGWVPGHQTISRLRWMDGQRETFARSFEAALSVAPREVAIWREYMDTLLHAELFDEVIAVVARARAAAGPNASFDAAETVATAEQGEIEAADRLFDRLGPIGHVTMAVRRVRHLLRAGRVEQAVALAGAWRQRDPEGFLWPYLAAGWRLTDDPRWQWLEGDSRLIGVYDLAGRVPSLDALAQRLRALHLATHQPLDQSLRGGTQTDGHLFNRIEPEVRAFREVILEAVAEHVAQLPPYDPGHPTLSVPRGRPIRFSGSWSVRLTGGGHHASHVHPAGWFSSACYVALPAVEERGAEPAGWLTLGEPPADLRLDLPPFRLVEPKPGRLVLFPSTMWHGTRPFEQGERLTVAFDVARPA